MNILMYKVNDELVISARDLSNELGLRNDNFSHWFKQQTSIFVENQEFGVFVVKDENPLGGRPQKNYWLTLDTAKHIALMSRTEKGREYRTRLIELEKEYSAPKQEIAPSSQADSFMALQLMTNDLNLPDSGKIQAYSIGMQDYPNFVKALPVYAVDKPIINNFVEVNVEGSSGVTHALSYHLKNHNIEKSAITINKLLLAKGIIEKKDRISSTGKIKYFNSLTEKGLKYGKNITNPKSQRETQPHYYDSKILGLLILVGA